MQALHEGSQDKISTEVQTKHQKTAPQQQSSKFNLLKRWLCKDHSSPARFSCLWLISHWYLNSLELLEKDAATEYPEVRIWATYQHEAEAK